MKKILVLLIAFLIGTQVIEGAIPGRVEMSDLCWVQFDTTDVFFYMSPNKFKLTEQIVRDINQEKIKLTVDINDFDCLTTELSAIASKYPEPLNNQTGQSIYADPIGHLTLETYAKNLKSILQNELNLHIQGLTREINFVFSQDAHKFHQDQSGKQFEFLNNQTSFTKPSKIIQDLTLIDWDMSKDTFSATIIQDSESEDRYLLTLFPNESVGLIFAQSPEYLSREAHPSYTQPTIFPYHAVLSPIDMKASSTPGSSKGKRLSTVVRGVVEEEEIDKLKQKAISLSINRPTKTNESNTTKSIYPNGIVTKNLDTHTLNLHKNTCSSVGYIYRHPDRENTEILELTCQQIAPLAEDLAREFEISAQFQRCLRIIKRDGGFSSFNQMKLGIESDQKVILLNASIIPPGYDYFNLAQDWTKNKLPWIQLYHVPNTKALLINGSTLSELSLTPIEEILFRDAKSDSIKTDGISCSNKIVTQIDLLIFR